MKIRNLYLRRKSSDWLTSGDEGSIDLIYKWTKGIFCNFNDFQTILKELGIALPIILRSSTKYRELQCIASDGKRLKIVFFPCNEFDIFTKLYVTEGIETREYICSPKEDVISSPRMLNVGKVIKSNNKILEIEYYNWLCKMTLWIRNTHTLDISISVPRDPSTNIIEPCTLQNSGAVEDYLLNLNNPIKVTEAYEKIQSLLEYDGVEDIIGDRFTYSEGVGKNQRILEEIFSLYGEIVAYHTRFSDGLLKTHLYGAWEYIADGIQIKYNPLKKVKEFLVDEVHSPLDDSKKKEMIENIKQKVSQVRKDLYL